MIGFLFFLYFLRLLLFFIKCLTSEIYLIIKIEILVETLSTLRNMICLLFTVSIWFKFEKISIAAINNLLNHRRKLLFTLINGRIDMIFLLNVHAFLQLLIELTFLNLLFFIAHTFTFRTWTMFFTHKLWIKLIKTAQKWRWNRCVRYLLENIPNHKNEAITSRKIYHCSIIWYHNFVFTL